MLTGLATLPWRGIGIAALAVAVAFFIGGRLAWDSRGRIDAAERKAEIAETEIAARELALEVERTAARLDAQTRRADAAITRAEAQGHTEIIDANEAGDVVGADAALRRAVERVWNEAGLSAAGDDHDPAGLVRTVPALDPA